MDKVKRWFSTNSDTNDSNTPSKCPVNHNSPMLNPNNLEAYETKPGRLPKHRVVSTIPKGEFTPDHQVKGEEYWRYPSEDQYFQAMKRKGWNPMEKDMKAVVAIHNTVNERGWREVQKWERLHGTANQVRLVKFMGRPKDISPRARIRSWFGYALPFDRHDWIVDRNGESVRYVIDFYTGKVNDGDRPLAMYLDVRPALDSFSNVYDRVRMSYRTDVMPYLPFRGGGDYGEQVEDSPPPGK